MKKLEEVGLVPLSKKECVEQFGGLDNMWEVFINIAVLIFGLQK